jgi:hypothetical protein
VNLRIFDIALALGPVAAWIGLYGVVLLITRPPRIQPGPATQDLGSEPPALVSLMANGWDVTVDAAESTLLDLGARRILEFRQPANDPMQTTVHIVQESPTGLTPYERRVFDRVAGLAVGGVVPLTALTFRDPAKAKAWWKRLRNEVIADARARGLSRRRVSPPWIGALTALAMLASAGPGYVAYNYLVRKGDDDPSGGALAAAFFTVIVLGALLGQSNGERDTPAGREVAGQWFGVHAWLKAHPAFSDLPPSAVAVWDRYLGYGAALGVTRVSSAVIDLGMGDRTRVWSSYGGTWHRVRVRYPSFGLRYGRPTPYLVLKVLITGAVGYGLTWLDERTSSSLQGIGGLISLATLVLGVALLVHAFYQLVRTIADLVSPVTRTGQVLWVQVWKTKKQNSNASVPTTFYLAIDDGTADRTTAWGLPAAMANSCEAGDTVRIEVRPWSRRVRTVTMVAKGRPGTSDAADEDDSAELAEEMLDGAAAAKARRRPAVAPTALLTAEEVSQALGMPVTSQETGLPGMAGMVQFSSTDRNQPVLILQVAEGALGRLAWRTSSRGDQLPGIGDAARVKGDRAVARLGDTTISVALFGPAKGMRQGLPRLLQQATSRFPTPVPADPTP